MKEVHHEKSLVLSIEVNYTRVSTKIKKMKKKKKTLKNLMLVISIFYRTCMVSVLFAQQPKEEVYQSQMLMM